MKIKPEIPMNEETWKHIIDLSRGDCFIFKIWDTKSRMFTYFDRGHNESTLTVNSGDVFMVTETRHTTDHYAEIIRLNTYEKFELRESPDTKMFNILKEAHVKTINLMDAVIDTNGLFKKCNISDIYVGDVFIAVSKDDDEINWFICIDDGGLHLPPSQTAPIRIMQYVDASLCIHETAIPGDKIPSQAVIKLLTCPDIKVPFKF